MRTLQRAVLVGLIVASSSARARAQDPDAPPPPPPEAFQATPGQEVLTGGPLHESFAQPVVYDPKPGPVVAKPPPPPIQEMPPDQRPEGPNVRWIPGYWAWDDGRNDYLWISGLWRNIPPGRQWVPGYWHEVEGGSRWAPGAWMPVQAPAAQTPYLPAPPASLESGPNAPAPMAGAVWAPGCWVWGGEQYAWRPGFWVAPQPNWIWVPATHVYTPSGYLYVAGYWDRPFASRGQLFAPVYFSEPLYAQPTFVYQPSIGIVATGLLASLFIRPSFGVYYFGDYYAPNYFSVGIYPAFAFHQSRFGYDPVFAYYSVTYSQSNPRWAHEMRESYLYRRDHVEARPPSTYREMVQINRTTNITVNRTTVINNNIRNVSFAAPITQIARASAASGSPMRFERVAPAEHRRFAAQASQVHQFSQERVRRESTGADGGGGARPRSFEMPRSPIAAAHPAALAREGMPGRQEAPGHQEAPHQTPPVAPSHPGLDHAARPLTAENPAARLEPHPGGAAPAEARRPIRREPAREERRPKH